MIDKLILAVDSNYASSELIETFQNFFAPRDIIIAIYPCKDDFMSHKNTAILCAQNYISALNVVASQLNDNSNFLLHSNYFPTISKKDINKKLNNFNEYHKYDKCPTSPFDANLIIARKISVSDDRPMFKIGLGYDIHCLKKGLPLILAAKKIPYHMGLLGHSDADVLIHALVDAILGALGKRDIGYHFSDKQDEYKNMSSSKFLVNVAHMLQQSHYHIANVDINIICQRPKLKIYIEQMISNIAKFLEIPVSRVNIKAKTNEKMDATGKNLAVIAHAVVLIERNQI